MTVQNKQPLWRFFLELLHSFLYFTPFVVYLVFIYAVQVFFYYLTPKKLFRKINKLLMDTFNTYIVYIFEFWANVNIKLYIDLEILKHIGRENAFLIPNHRYDLDLFTLLSLSYKFPTRSNIRGFAKEEIAAVPILGACFKMAGNVILKQSFEYDEDTIKKQVEKLCDFEDNLWALLYLEGTRFTKARHFAAQMIAFKFNRKFYHHHLVPRTKAFCMLIESIRCKYRALYDIQIAFTGANNSGTIDGALRGVLGGSKSQVAHIFIDRRLMVEVPRHKDGQEIYLSNLFQKKDALMDVFLKTGSFTTESNKLYPISLTKSWFVLAIVLVTALPMHCVILNYLYYLIVTGKFYSAILTAASLLTVTYGIRRRILNIFKIERN